MTDFLQLLISGMATGAIYAVRLLERLRAAGRETHVVVSPAGVLNVHHELGLDRKACETLAERHGARFAPPQLLRRMADLGERFYDL